MEMNPGTASAAGWSWFKLVVFRDKEVESLERDGQLLAWRSHGEEGSA